ncbi:methionyl-tRNA formyltransferase [Haoranjiania flava]|uniref:Methionyl-tRNA formyltransferase n=1 Tax=Haoranjiania flava TaxID=1856322 RepID=A0AAE3LN09_9BACT|nr:methionyl-tRNA formyltransferase [Haoranjiania flava]MCU7694466.1 methionyl-tRNA formyltransferase [Haoranjiania flava]
MDFKDLRIVFLGTPEFAVASLKALVNAGANIVGVVTAPDKPAGRGMKLTASAVKKYASEKNIPLLQPEKLRDPGFLEMLQDLNADLQIVVAFRMLPKAVWNMPRLGTVNLHASLLPQYRGAAPINWAIINGETETGLTTFKLRHEIDTGNILLQEKVAVLPEDNAGTLHDKMKDIGGRLVVKTVEAIAAGNIVESVQTMEGRQLKTAPKLYKETCKINFEDTAASIHNLVRGLSPFPAAFTYLQEKLVKIYVSVPETEAHNHTPGEFFTDGKTYLKFACRDGFLNVKELQLEGKKRMQVADFLRGHRFDSLYD